MDNTLRMIGLAMKAGRLEAGEEPAGQCCREKRCRLLLTASDAAEGTLRRAEHFAAEGACLLAGLPFSKEELGGPGRRPEAGGCGPGAVPGDGGEAPRQGGAGRPAAGENRRGEGTAAERETPRFCEKI